MANENQAEYIGACALIKIEWGNGTTHRYITALGYVNYGSEIWIDGDDTQGQLLAVGDLIEKSGEVPYRDFTITETATIQGIIEGGYWENSRVTIIEGNRDPATTTFTAFTTSYWRIADLPEDKGLGESATFTLSSEALAESLNHGDTPTYSANTQALLLGTGITDTGFRYISNTTSTDGTAGSPGIISGGNSRFDNQTINIRNYI